LQQAAICASPRTLGSAPAMLSVPARFGASAACSLSSWRLRASAIQPNTARLPPSARAVRPSAASEPIEAHRRRSAAWSPRVGAGIKAGSHSKLSAVSGWAIFPRSERPNSKHNAGMASFRYKSVVTGSAVVKTGVIAWPARSGHKTLPNPSVEATNCSKLQFAPHLER
jgi:hypothetical protein